MNNICYIFGACLNEAPIEIYKNKDDYVIAADGGYNLIKDKELIDILLGDFDSITELPKCDNIIKYPVEKDDTDLFIAYNTAKKLGYKNYVIYGGIGGRIDHTYANMQLLVKMTKNGDRGYLINDKTVITAITNTSITIPAKNSGIISVFCMGDCAYGVDITGLKYTVKNKELTYDYPLGISNEFIGEDAKISVQNGTLMIIWYDDDIKSQDLFNF